MKESLTRPTAMEPAIEAAAAQEDEQRRRRVSRIKRAIRRKTSGGVHALAVELSDDAITLRGRCTSFYCKQIAQHAVLSHLDGEALVNEIEVDNLPR